ncbi:MAG: hypothetical protein AAF587_42505 [Bacteroidota bacterium]
MKQFLFFSFSFLLFLPLHSQEYRKDFDYFGQGSDSTYCFRFEDSSQTWRNEFINYTYWNESLSLDSIRGIFWNTSTLEYDPWYYNRYTYDSITGKELSKVLTTWKANSMQWEDIQRIQTSYTNSGLVDEILTEDQIANSGWFIRNKQTHQYDQQDQLQETFTLDWDTTQTSWTPRQHRVYQYDSLDQLIFILTERWKSSSQIWVLNSDLSIQRDPTGKASEELHRIFVDSALKTQRRFVPQYDSLDRLVESLSNSWLDTDPSWKPASRFYYELDSVGRMTRYGLDEWSVSQGVWKQISYCDVYGGFLPPNTTSVEEELLSSAILCSFPNPYTIGSPIACDQLLAGGQYTLRLWDQQGRLVQRGIIRKDQPPVLKKTISPGLYFLSIWEKGRILQQQKILIQD